MVLTAVTVAVAFLDLRFMNTVVALTIAVTKATLVVLFFMHLKYSTRLTWVVAGSGFVWLAIMFALTLSDYVSRGWVNAAQ
jgi:cytochrome c oxidase subunit 4